jgi:predicted transcriptional regulator
LEKRTVVGMENREIPGRVSSKKGPRGRLEHIADILSLCTSAMKKTHLMQRANLNTEQIDAYLNKLIAKQLIRRECSQDGKNIGYTVSDDGRKFLSHYSIMKSVLGEEESAGV